MKTGFYADDMSVRFETGAPLCVTSHSIHLDNADGYAIKSYAGRQKWARIIADALNQYFASKQPDQQPEI